MQSAPALRPDTAVASSGSSDIVYVMPFAWEHTESDAKGEELHLWPHQSLRPQGFAGMILMAFAFLLMPLLALLGTVLLWGLLPFLLAALGGLWLALSRSRRDAQILEVLTLSEDTAHLTRRNPRGDVQEWESNRYWVEPRLHENGGPVPYYVTLKGSGREVEIGAFLSEDERKALFKDLQRALRR